MIEGEKKVKIIEEIERSGRVNLMGINIYNYNKIRKENVMKEK